MTPSGAPFFLQADTPWSLMVALNTNEVELYLETRRQQGFNAVVANLIEHAFGGVDNAFGAPKNRQGEAPFLAAHDFSKPNDAYFAHAEWVVRRAAEKGILVVMTPCYIGFPGTIEGWYAEVMTNGVARCRDYGRYVGQRFRAHPNVVWVMYGDRNPDDATPMMEAMVEGLRETDTNHLITAHFQRYVSARDYLEGSPWLSFNTTYTAEIVHQEALQDYRRNPAMPSILFEGRYEGERNISTAGIRKQAYTAMLCGLAGHAYGNRPMWLFDRGWQQALTSPGAASMIHVRNLFLSRRWHLLEPDDAHQVLTLGVGTTDNYVAAARASDGSSVLAYLPIGGTVTVDLRRLGGARAKAWWFNVRDGSASAIGVFPATGPAVFTAPTTEDWGLVIDDADLGLAAPGSAPLTGAGLRADAGLDLNVPLSAAPSAVLDGRAFENGEPAEPTGLQVIWTQVAGPAPAAFEPGPTVLAPRVRFPAAGSYGFRLTVSRETAVDFDEVLVTVQASESPMAPTQLSTDGAVAPFGLLNPAPVLSWRFEDPDAGDAQKAFRVEVFASSGALQWDSGQVISDHPEVAYAGPSLSSGAAYRWRVTVWDRFEMSSPPSELAWMTLADVSPELLTNPGFELGSTFGWSERVPGAMSVGFKPFFGRSGPRTGQFQAFWNQSEVTHYTFQTVSLAPYAASIDSGAAWIDASGWLVADDYRLDPPWDQFYLQVRFHDASGAELQSARYDSGIRNVPTWERYGLTAAPIPFGARSVEVRFNTFELGYDAGVADDFTVRVYTLPTLPVVMIQAPPQTPAEIQASGFRLSFSANRPGSYRVESSPDLLNWTGFTDLEYQSGTVWLADAGADRQSGRFYRARRL